MRWLLLVLLLIPSTLLGQSVPALNGIYKEVARGDQVELTWDYAGDREPVKFFRLRRAQTFAGAYINFATVSKASSSFSFTATLSCHIFISTVWDETQPDGSTVTRESPGSNHVQIIVK